MLTVTGNPQHQGALWDDFLKRIDECKEDIGAEAELELRFTDRAELYLRSQDLTLVKPFSLDFTSDKLIWRISHSGRHSEAVARAVMGKNDSPVVFDATAGLGRDSFILQCCGCKVTMFERSPVIWALLYDALLRANENPEFLGSLPNGLPALAPLGPLYEHEEFGQADAVYYDPMFPPRRKSALVKQEMRVLHSTVGADLDCDEVLPLLIKRAKGRVVVKRPAGAPAVCEGILKPAGSADGKACRFDIYASGQG